MDSSDSEAGSEVDDVLGPEDLFNEEADEDKLSAKEDEIEVKSNKPDEGSKATVEKRKPKRVVKNPRVLLNYDSLTKPSGLPALKKLFADFKFRGNGHEKEDLTKLMGILQQWMCYQLCPSYDFESCMLQLETLGKKKVVQTVMKKYRMGIDDWGERRSDNEEKEGDDKMEICEPSAENQFDLLLNEVIADIDSEGELIPTSGETETQQNREKEPELTLTAEQLERIARNRKLAEERRMKRMSQQEQSNTDVSANDSEAGSVQLDDNT